MIFPSQGLLIQQAADQGGLSRAVVSQQGDALPALDQEVHIGKQLLLSEALGQTLGLKHHVSLKIPLGKGGLHGLLQRRLFRLLDPLHPVLDGHGPAI